MCVHVQASSPTLALHVCSPVRAMPSRATLCCAMGLAMVGVSLSVCACGQRLGWGRGCGHIWCGLMCALVWSYNPNCVLYRCNFVIDSCMSAARRYAVCLGWCGCGACFSGGGGCGHIWCGLMCVHVLACTPVCVLCRCFQVQAICSSAARRSMACEAMPGVSPTWSGRGFGREGAVGTCGLH